MNKIVYLLLSLCIFTSCETDDTVPFLSIPQEDAQIVQMYVEVEQANNLTFSPIIYASQMIISWGDNSRPVEYVNPDSLKVPPALKALEYKFSGVNEFLVDVKALKVTRLDISKDSSHQNIKELVLKNCGHLKSLSCQKQALQTINIEKTGLKTLDMTSLTLLEDLSVSSCDSLSVIILDQNKVLRNVNLSDNVQFTASSLNILFGQLPQTTGDNRIITLTNNAGDKTCDITIATQKGWTVQVLSRDNTN